MFVKNKDSVLFRIVVHTFTAVQYIMFLSAHLTTMLVGATNFAANFMYPMNAAILFWKLRSAYLYSSQDTGISFGIESQVGCIPFFNSFFDKLVQ